MLRSNKPESIGKYSSVFFVDKYLNMYYVMANDGCDSIWIAFFETEEEAKTCAQALEETYNKYVKS